MPSGCVVAQFGREFSGRSVFLTGHTGFKGSWLAIWLHQLGARVAGYSRGVPSSPSNFEAAGVRKLLDRHYDADVLDFNALSQAIGEADPDVIFHLAAQPLVRSSYQTPRETFESNVMGMEGSPIPMGDRGRLRTAAIRSAAARAHAGSVENGTSA